MCKHAERPKDQATKAPTAECRNKENGNFSRDDPCQTGRKNLQKTRTNTSKTQTNHEESGKKPRRTHTNNENPGSKLKHLSEPGALITPYPLTTTATDHEPPWTKESPQLLPTCITSTHTQRQQQHKSKWGQLMNPPTLNIMDEKSRYFMANRRRIQGLKHSAGHNGRLEV